MAGRSSIVEQRVPLVSAGAYRRVVAASIERVWENVLDWEHLPYLHHDSFTAIHILASSGEGWRAVVTMVPDLGGGESEIEVVLDKPHLSYTTRTLDGAGAGTEIVTSLEPFDNATTRVDVDFLVPGLDDAQIEIVGVYYRRLYARLWDQDEAMMGERQRQLDRAAHVPLRARALDSVRAPVPLGDEASLRRRLPLLIEIAGRLYRMAEDRGEIVVHSAVCPHTGGPLGGAHIDEHGCITCPWHGYRFDVRTCRSADGKRLKLARAPHVEVDAATGEAFLRWAA
jgi:nitrite reductase/ring-hydroxylating ferredoxin subunit